MTDKPAPLRTYTRVAGGKRSFQYYALRQNHSWTMSEKSRCWATVMKDAWGDDLDAITLLGIEPKPLERDWRRFEETRELVDLGRNFKCADDLLDKLKKEAGEEVSLQFTAARDLAYELEQQMVQLITESKAHDTKCAEGFSTRGAAFAIRHTDMDDAVKAGFMADFAKPFKDELTTATRDCDNVVASHVAARVVLDSALREISDKLLAGKNDANGWDPIAKAAVELWPERAVFWRKSVVSRLEQAEEIDVARQTLADRRRELELDKLTRAAGGVSGVQGASL